MKIGIKFFLNVALLCTLACSSSSVEHRKDIARDGSAAQPSEPVGAVTTASPAAEKVLAAVRKLAAVRSFRALMTTAGTPAKSLKTQMTVILPDRFHVLSEQYELIAVGADTYMRLPDQAWQKSSARTDVTNFTDPRKLEAYLSMASEITSLGPGIDEGAAVRIYQAKINRAPSSGPHLNPQPFTVKLWARETDGCLRKLEGKSDHSPVTTTVVYYDFDANFNVTLPIL